MKRITMDRVDAYELRVCWSEEDEAFVARVTELPSLATHGETRESALEEIKALLSFVMEDMEREGEPLPEPLSARGEYSSRKSSP